MRGLDPRSHRTARTIDAVYVYVLASQKNGTLYIGVTNDLVRRAGEHKQNVVKGFTRKYSVHQLVYFEICDDVRLAIQRERTMKHWRRDWKIALIERSSPHLRDLYDDVAR